jgi:hypothetical protein
MSVTDDDLPPEYCLECTDDVPCERHRQPVKVPARVVPRSQDYRRSAPGQPVTAGDVVYAHMVMAEARARLGALQRGADEKMRQAEALETLDLIVGLFRLFTFPIDPAIGLMLEGMRRTIHEVMEP